MYLIALGLVVGAAWFAFAPGGDHLKTTPTRLDAATAVSGRGLGRAPSQSQLHCIKDWNSWIDSGSKATHLPVRAARDDEWTASVSVYRGQAVSDLNPGDCVITLANRASWRSFIFASVQGNYAEVFRAAPPSELKVLTAKARDVPNAVIDADAHLWAR